MILAQIAPNQIAIQTQTQTDFLQLTKDPRVARKGIKRNNYGTQFILQPPR